MVDISRKTYERNGVETIVGCIAILWLYEKHIKEGCDHKNFQVTTVKYPSGYRKHRYDFYTQRISNKSNYGL